MKVTSGGGSLATSFDSYLCFGRSSESCKVVSDIASVRNSTKTKRELVLEKGSTMRISTKRKGTA